MVLDIIGVTFGDSTFLNPLIRTHQQADLRIVGLCAPLDCLFELVGVGAVLRLFPSVEDARALRQQWAGHGPTMP
ncbi:hypothetical protein [Streptomyces sp. NPDC008139]|uniref:hypothetical protein n=1 Tax=Streptomyces sp. NPDC008139 TaxID=3364814 RepID=UPI0036E7F3AB